MADPSDDLFRAIVEASPDLIVLLSMSGEVEYASPSAIRAFGEPEFRHIDDLLSRTSPDEAADLRRSLAELSQRDAALAITLTTDDGPRQLELQIRSQVLAVDVEGVVIFARDATAEHRLRSDLKRQATEDELTSLPNRRALRQLTSQACARAVRNGTSAAFVLIDLDGFKGVNDSLGHPFGDSLLIEVADRLRRHNRDGESVGRIGGDEFAIVLEGITDPDEALLAAERLLECIRVPYAIGQEMLSIDASAGVAIAGPSTEPDQLFRQADIALYEAKHRGRGQVEMFSIEFEQLLADEARFAREIEEGFDKGEFYLVYQPIVSMDTHEAVGFEALMRWNSATLGEVEPLTFIPIAERSGFIVELGSWALEESCRRLHDWSAFNADGMLWMSVNVSARQLRDKRFVDLVRGTLEASAIDSTRLQLEITETAMIEDIVGAAEMLEEIRAMGVRIALDDFGTGYSSMGQLQGLPVDCIKIDRVFLQNAAQSDSARSVLQALMEFGRTLAPQERLGVATGSTVGQEPVA
jgi:diguanylate cyclase (GGDEF)-like protein